MKRISLARLLGFIGLFAVGLAAIARASLMWNGIIYTIMVGSLFAGLLGAIILGRRGGRWIGFALFGWGYFALHFLPSFPITADYLPDESAGWVYDRANPAPVEPKPAAPAPPAVPMTSPPVSSPLVDPAGPVLDLSYQYAINHHSFNRTQAEQIGFSLFVLLFALSGSILGGHLSRRLDATSPPGPR